MPKSSTAREIRLENWSGFPSFEGERRAPDGRRFTKIAYSDNSMAPAYAFRNPQSDLDLRTAWFLLMDSWVLARVFFEWCLPSLAIISSVDPESVVSGRRCATPAPPSAPSR